MRFRKTTLGTLFVALIIVSGTTFARTDSGARMKDRLCARLKNRFGIICSIGASTSQSRSRRSSGAQASDASSPIRFLQRDFGTLKFNRQLGQEYIEREYRSFPLDRMVRGDAVKYGPVGVNVIVIQFTGNKDEFVGNALAAYSQNFDAEKLGPPAYPSMYKLTQRDNTTNQVALWLSSDFLIIVHGDGIFTDGSDAEDILEAYLPLYPASSL